MQRYSNTCRGMVKDEEGNIVLYSDHVKEVERLRDALGRIIEEIPDNPKLPIVILIKAIAQEALKEDP